jgi:hypothetical protein
MDDSDIKQNPHPKQAYEITVDVKGAPGIFDTVSGSSVFRIANRECVPKDPISGVAKLPATFPSTQLQRLGNGRYHATIFLDLLEDGDYFGRGVCHWRLEGFIVSLEANGRSFGTDMPTDSIRAQRTETRFIAKKLFDGTGAKDLSVAGVPMSEYVREHADEFFAITVTAKERPDEQRME